MSWVDSPNQVSTKLTRSCILLIDRDVYLAVVYISPEYTSNIDRDVYLAVVYISPEYSSNIDRDVYLAVVYISPEYSSNIDRDVYLAVVYISPEYSSNIYRDVYLAVVYISTEYSSNIYSDVLPFKSPVVRPFKILILVSLQKFSNNLPLLLVCLWSRLFLDIIVSE
jgi:hypothetical protein